MRYEFEKMILERIMWRSVTSGNHIWTSKSNKWNKESINVNSKSCTLRLSAVIILNKGLLYSFSNVILKYTDRTLNIYLVNVCYLRLESVFVGDVRECNESAIWCFVAELAFRRLYLFTFAFTKVLYIALFFSVNFVASLVTEIVILEHNYITNYLFNFLKYTYCLAFFSYMY